MNFEYVRMIENVNFHLFEFPYFEEFSYFSKVTVHVLTVSFRIRLWQSFDWELQSESQNRNPKNRLRTYV